MVINVLFNASNKGGLLLVVDALISQSKVFGSKDKLILQTWEMTSENASTFGSFIV